MDYNLLLIYAQGKVFVGKGFPISDPSYLEECIECLPTMTPDGRYMILGNLLGTMDIPKDCVLVTLSKESLYYKNYIQTTTGVEVVKADPRFGSGPRRVN